MTTAALARGANTTIDETAVTALVAWRSGATVDACALLVGEGGKVRGDADFVFYNQPQDGSGAVRLSTDGVGAATLAVDLARVPADVSSVVVAGSMDTGTFDGVPGLEVTVKGRRGQVVARFPLRDVEPVTAVVFGEFYRRQGRWKFRAIGQGWDSGLEGLATAYGVTVEADPAEDAAAPAATPAVRADWYVAPDNPSLLRWWNGTEWSVQTVPLIHDTPTVCGRCGGPKYRSYAGVPSACRRCEPEIANVLNVWRTRAARVLAATGTAEPAWSQLWAELRYHRVREEAGREALRPAALHHLHQLLTFAFADGVIEQHEMDAFDDAVRALGVVDPAISQLRRRLRRGLELGLISGGDVPRATSSTLHLDADEILHLDVPATRVRQLASGTRRNSGRLIVTNTKLRFVGEGAGADLAWSKVIEARPEYGTVVVAATTSRGGGTYEVGDPEYVAAVLTGVLKVAKRIATVPGQRDSRSVPPAIRAEVWRRDGGACVECQATEYLEFDHVIPWSRGGATSVGNLQLLCRRCNLAKGARI
ncbi:TerD family protein [Dactylosporangium aurantiacum]|uniref:TerD family protein n=1 Tax=Dactylosporangium aurantiacum TaxID=35754 RepID=A0A9Q9IFV9_9ACTN|nr:TerD family protein [Dactylosporangium aurantiacum]MDG6101753.1 TerD family protein [Dactylosporangium aurantiacum]UWZ52438.1 TerD family protein [Dactylosporangium aurantiacum]